MRLRQIIRLTVLALMLLAWVGGLLDFVTFCLLIFISAVLANVFDPLPAQKPAAKPAQEREPEDDPSPDEIIRVRRRAVEQIRNSLLRHHNSRGTDQAYQTSDAAKETTAIIQVLNGALAKKIHQTR